MSQDWTSYDTAADTHDRLAVPAWFAAPARDLAARMDFGRARAALDVGTGSGVVASAASACPFVVGLDPSMAMLRRARANGVASVVVAAVPGLPFPGAAFDRVTAAFVLSHVASCRDALADMRRVLRLGGLLGATAWSARPNEFRDFWDGLVKRFVDPEALRAADARMVPWEDWLGDPANFRAALADAGLLDVAVEEIECLVHITIADFLAVREDSGKARFLRTVLDDEGWRRFRQTARDEFHARFHDPIDHTRHALIAVGRAP